MLLDFIVDHAGFLVWVYLTVISIIDLRNKKLRTLSRYILLGIGIIGILLDATLLISFYYGFQLGWVFDFLGLPVFCFIIWLSIKDLKNEEIKRPNWTKIVLLILGIGGLIADSFVLIFNLLS